MGRLKQNRWSDAEGKNHSRVCIVAEKVEFKAEKQNFAENSKKNAPSASSEFSPHHGEYVPTF
jgi:single-stranded DNA-binding protein